MRHRRANRQEQHQRAVRNLEQRSLVGHPVDGLRALCTGQIRRAARRFGRKPLRRGESQWRGTHAEHQHECSRLRLCAEGGQQHRGNQEQRQPEVGRKRVHQDRSGRIRYGRRWQHHSHGGELHRQERQSREFDQLERWHRPPYPDDGAEPERVSGDGVGPVVLPAFGLGVGERSHDRWRDQHRRQAHRLPRRSRLLLLRPRAQHTQDLHLEGQRYLRGQLHDSRRALRGHVQRRDLLPDSGPWVCGEVSVVTLIWKVVAGLVLATIFCVGGKRLGEFHG